MKKSNQFNYIERPGLVDQINQCSSGVQLKEPKKMQAPYFSFFENLCFSETAATDWKSSQLLAGTRREKVWAQNKIITKSSQFTIDNLSTDQCPDMAGKIHSIVG